MFFTEPIPPKIEPTWPSRYSLKVIFFLQSAVLCMLDWQNWRQKMEWIDPDPGGAPFCDMVLWVYLPVASKLLLEFVIWCCNDQVRVHRAWAAETGGRAWVHGGRPYVELPNVTPPWSLLWAPSHDGLVSPFPDTRSSPYHYCLGYPLLFLVDTQGLPKGWAPVLGALLTFSTGPGGSRRAFIYWNNTSLLTSLSYLHSRKKGRLLFAITFLVWEGFSEVAEVLRATGGHNFRHLSGMKRNQKEPLLPCWTATGLVDYKDGDPTWLPSSYQGLASIKGPVLWSSEDLENGLLRMFHLFLGILISF